MGIRSMPTLIGEARRIGGAIALFEPVANGAVDRISGTAGTLTNGATSTTLLGRRPAVATDGSNDYVSFGTPTRRNLEPDQPQFNAIGSWSGSNASTAISTDYAYVGTQSLKVTSTVNGTCYAVNGNTVGTNAAVTAGTTYARSIRVRAGSTARSVRVAFRWIDAGGATISDSNGSLVAAPTGAWTELTVSDTAPVGAVRSRIVLQWDNTLVGEVFYVDAAITESGATTGAYFDGSGYVNGSGTWVAAAGTNCGWLGTAHASTSDYGPFANGTTRTFFGVARLSADAGVGVGQVLVSSNQSGGVGTIVRLINTAGTREIRAAIGGTAYTWTLTAGEIAATAAGQTFTYCFEFNETADTASLRINTLAAVSKSSVTTQHGAGQTTVQLGAFGSGSSPFPGKLGPAVIFGRALTTGEVPRLVAVASR